MPRLVNAARAAVLLVLATATAAGAAGPAMASDSPPAWTDATSVCDDVSLTGTYPSGVSGPLAGGYNATVLRIVGKRGVSCSSARRLARKEWSSGSAAPLRWHERRHWRSSGGSAYIGDFVGIKGRKRVEFFAVH